jgi:hypothetical protein
MSHIRALRRWPESIHYSETKIVEKPRESLHNRHIKQKHYLIHKALPTQKNPIPLNKPQAMRHHTPHSAGIWLLPGTS